MNTPRADLIRCQPDEMPAPGLLLGLSLQIVTLSIAGVILIPTIVMRAGGASGSYLVWAVFTTVVICGVATILHALRAGRIGSGFLVVMGPTSAFIAVCVDALEAGGPPLLATLVTVSALVPLLLAVQLPLFQRMLTPAVSATVLMLIPATVMPAVFSLLNDVPDDVPGMAAPLSAVTVLFVITAVALKASGGLRLWGPMAGVVAGTAVAAAFGIYDTGSIIEARWFGYPSNEWVGFNLEFGEAFWSLLPAFLLVAAIASVRTVSSAIAIQRVSWRRPRAVDFRAVQGAVTVDGLGNLLAGFAGTTPNAATTVGASITELTGVAARSVGVAAGVIFVVFAFLPKFLAVILAIPGPVVAAYLGILLALIFIVGMKVASQDGIDPRRGLIIGVSFWIGIGFQYGLIFPAWSAEFGGGFMRNGITTGGIAAILMTMFLELTKPPRSRIETLFGNAALPETKPFLEKFIAQNGLDKATAERLESACEETLLALLNQGGGTGEKPRYLRLAVYREAMEAVLEFTVAAQDDNIQDWLSLIAENPGPATDDRQISLRLLHHVSSSVHHRQFHGTDIVTVRVAASSSRTDPKQ
ncbi:MAG: hypothetical protein OXF74_14515 [Rhodobacteraceae bacterium]|nr:hypothetical protein [Paracoccaceae bacterium]